MQLEVCIGMSSEVKVTRYLNILQRLNLAPVQTAQIDPDMSIVTNSIVGKPVGVELRSREMADQRTVASCNDLHPGLQSSIISCSSSDSPLAPPSFRLIALVSASSPPTILS